MQYRVKQHVCIHAGVEYNVGDIMPQLPVELLNVHLPNLEVVDSAPATPPTVPADPE